MEAMRVSLDEFSRYVKERQQQERRWREAAFQRALGGAHAETIVIAKSP
jgi:hypothetical protein